MKEKDKQRRSETPQAKHQVSSSLHISPCVICLSEVVSSAAMLVLRLRENLLQCGDTLGNDVNMMPILHELMRDFAGKQH